MKISKPLSRAAKWAAIAVVTIVLLFVAIMTLCVWILTPNRLTPILRDAAAESLPAVEVSLDRAELTFWHTFPRLFIQLDSVAVVNPDFDLADGKTIFNAARLRGGIDILSLLRGNFSIYDAEISDLHLNVVALNDSLSNITPLLTAETDTTQSELSLPEFAINRFDIVDSVAIHYRQVADSLYFDLTLRPSCLLAGGDGNYNVDLTSNISFGKMSPLAIEGKPLNANGGIAWSPATPMEVGLNDFNVTIGDIPAKFTTRIDFADNLTVKSGNVDLGPVSIDALRPFIDDSQLPEINKLETDMAFTLTATLKEPYVVASDTVIIPDIVGTINIPECSLTYDRLAFTDVTLDADYYIEGCNLDLSTVNVKKFAANGQAISASFSGKATNLIADPYLDGKMTLKMALNRLPRQLLATYGAKASGDIALEAAAKLNLSDLSPKYFYRADLKGRLTLSNLNVEIPDSAISFFTRKAVFGLGTHTSYKGAENRVDSLLRASIAIDTLALTYGDIDLTMAQVKGGFGCENRPPSADTTVVIPLGAGLRVKSLALISADSLKMRMRNAAITGRVQRYEGNRHLPHMSLTASADAIFASDGSNFAGLRDGNITADAFVRTRKQVADSLRQRHRANPRMPVDTINTIEILDKSMVGLMNRWQMTGTMTARHGMFFTPAMPLRNRLSDLDMTFSCDSVVLKSLKYKAGHSDFSVKGTISNIRRAANRRGDLTVKCAVKSDTLDVDELLHVAALGSEYLAGNTTATTPLTNVTIDNVDLIGDTQVDTEAPLSAILVPTNFDADLDLSANYVLYSQLPVHDFDGCLLMKNGAINLHELKATSALGGVSMSALYSAPRIDKIRFGIGVQLKRIDVKQFIDLMPAIDSIMPLLKSFKGIIDADIAATTDLDSIMDVKLPTLDAAVKLTGDSLSLLDAETFKTLKKWLRFKGSQDNQIEHMEVEMLINNSMMEIFPFVFNFDRYRLAVMGSNDLALNYKYHVSVLKSPIPLKFGLNISGNPDKMKVRLGRAKYKEGMAGQSVALVDTTRINLLAEMQRVFRAGTNRRTLGRLAVNRNQAASLVEVADSGLTHADSLVMINEGLIERPDTTAVAATATTAQSKKSKKKK